MDFTHLESLARDPRAKLLVLCSPHNPVGRVWTRAELTRLGEICADNGVLVISDEIHADIVFSGKHIVFSTLDERFAKRSIILTSTSKSFNLAGLQLANVIISDNDLRAIFKRQVEIDGYSNVSHFGYAATIAAYNEGAEWLDALIAYLRENVEYFKAFISHAFPSAVISPLEGTYLPWVNFKCLGLDPERLERFMRMEAGLFLDEGYLFGTGGEGYERFNIALPRAELHKALARLESAGRARGFIKGSVLL
jgi:cystathionine beta-lyase